MELISAPFDDKNLCDDSLRDEIFSGFFETDDMRDGKSHMIGKLNVDNDRFYIDAYVSAEWNSQSNTICLEMLACPSQSDFFFMIDDFYKYYTEIFERWENQDCEYLKVVFRREKNKLFVSFFFKCE